MTDLTLLGKAVLGGFVADAATLPLHWHYDVDKMKALLVEAGRLKTPEFMSPMATQYYSSKDFPGHYDLGQLSCYGEQSVMTLEYFKANGNKFIGGESFAQFMFKWFTDYTGRPDHPTKEFLEKAKKLTEGKKPLFPDAGADDIQTMHTFKIPVIALALMNGNEEVFFKAIDDACRAHQNTDLISHFAKAYALIIKNLVQGKALGTIVEEMIKGDIEVDAEVKSALDYTLQRKAKPSLDEDGWDHSLKDFATELSPWLFAKYGGAEYLEKIYALVCRFPGSFMASLKILLDTFEEYPNPEDFKNEAFAFAVRRNIHFGGDNCGRSFTIGPLLVLCGAEIPEGWVNQVNADDMKAFVALIKAVQS